MTRNKMPFYIFATLLPVFLVGCAGGSAEKLKNDSDSAFPVPVLRSATAFPVPVLRPAQMPEDEIEMVAKPEIESVEVIEVVEELKEQAPIKSVAIEESVEKSVEAASAIKAKAPVFVETVLLPDSVVNATELQIPKEIFPKAKKKSIAKLPSSAVPKEGVWDFSAAEQVKDVANSSLYSVGYKGMKAYAGTTKKVEVGAASVSCTRQDEIIKSLTRKLSILEREKEKLRAKMLGGTGK